MLFRNVLSARYQNEGDKTRKDKVLVLDLHFENVSESVFLRFAEPISDKAQ